jgi:uncharacterized protein
MLPSDLLINRLSGETIVPKRLALTKPHLTLATELIACFDSHRNETQGDLDRHLTQLEGGEIDFKIKRGLAHVIKSGFCEFEIVSPLDPIALRDRIFNLSVQSIPSPAQTVITLETIAQQLTVEFERPVEVEEVQQGLYADLPENRRLTQYDRPEPDAIIHRYNLSQVQGIFYQATQVIINAHRNDPGEYKLLFRYLKLFQLMAYIEGDADHGFTITVDGPTSLFKANTRYGLSLAKLLPALLHVTRWSLVAELRRKDAYSKEVKMGRFSLESDCGLVSHYPPGKTYDSLIEESFVDRWTKLNSEWVLEREVDLIPIPGSVMIPDFRLVHPDGRSWLLEIVGYWRSDYLKKKFSQVRQSGRNDLILAVSERLNLEKAGIKIEDVPAKVIWFKDQLLPKTVLAVLD